MKLALKAAEKGMGGLAAFIEKERKSEAADKKKEKNEYSSAEGQSYTNDLSGRKEECSLERESGE